MFQIVAFLLILGIDLYAFQSLKSVSANFGESIKILIYILYWLICIGLPLVMIVSFFQYSKIGLMPSWGRISGSLFLSVLITQLIVIVFLLGEDIFRIFYRIFSSLTQSDEAGNVFASRRKFLSQTAIIVASVPFLSFIYGITKGKFNYKVHRTILYLKDLPKAFEGYKIVQISDVHSGSYDDPEGVIKGIDLINEQDADLFVFTGDLVNTKADELDPWLDIFSKIQSKNGKYSILGNHDYGDYFDWQSKEDKLANFNKLLEYQKTIGFQLLLDEHVKITKGDDSINLIGVHNWGKKFGQRGDLDKAIIGMESKGINILLSHDPTHFDSKVKDHQVHFHLTLSGHTHGAQMGVEFPFLKWSPVKYIYPKWAGLYSENGRYLYVNRGFGYLGFAGRVGIWPEISVFELHSA
jgi:predicted MPP superfamily phosphohydrolase